MSLKRRIDALDPSHRRIVRGLFTVVFFVLIGKFAAAARDVVIAYRYGINDSLDVYVLAFGMASWLPAIWVSVLHVVYVPLMGKLKSESRATFAAQLHTASWLVSAVLGIAVWLLLPSLLPRMATGFSTDAIADLKIVGAQLAPLTALGILAAFYSSMLLAEERHSNTLLEAVPALAMLLAVLLWPHHRDSSPLVWGTLFGTALQTFLLWWLLKRTGSAPTLARGISGDGWHYFRQATGFMVLSQALFSISGPVDQYLAAGLDEGSLATLSYANRLLSLAIGLGATAIGRAILPVLSDADLSLSKRYALGRRWFFILAAGGFVAMAVGYVLTPILVKLIFERGAFTSDDTRVVSEAIRYGLLQLPFYFSSIVLVQLFASVGRYHIIAASTVLPILIKVTLGPYLVARIGLSGVLISTAAMYLVNSVYFYLMAQRSGLDQNADATGDR